MLHGGLRVYVFLLLEGQFMVWLFLSFFQLVLEAVRARQLQDALLMEKRTMEREVQQANTSLCFYDMRAARVEDQVFLSLIFGFE